MKHSVSRLLFSCGMVQNIGTVFCLMLLFSSCQPHKEERIITVFGPAIHIKSTGNIIFSDEASWNYEKALSKSLDEDYTEAMDFAIKADVLEPGNPHILKLMGLLKFYLKNSTGAVQLLRDAIEADPGNSESYLILSMIQNGLGSSRQALKNLDKMSLYNLSNEEYASIFLQKIKSFSMLNDCDSAQFYEADIRKIPLPTKARKYLDWHLERSGIDICYETVEP